MSNAGSGIRRCAERGAKRVIVLIAVVLVLLATLLTTLVLAVKTRSREPEAPPTARETEAVDEPKREPQAAQLRLLFNFCLAGDATSVRRILEQEPSLAAARTEDGHTALHLTPTRKIAEILIGYGADVNARSDSCLRRNTTPLHVAVWSTTWPGDRGLRLVELLLEHGADVHARADERNNLASPLKNVTPLWLAAYGGASTRVIELLLRYGADPYAKCDRGSSAVDLARDDPEALALLLQYGERRGLETPTDVRDPQGTSPGQAGSDAQE